MVFLSPDVVTKYQPYIGPLGKHKIKNSFYNNAYISGSRVKKLLN
jgi:hypothetical protein